LVTAPPVFAVGAGRTRPKVGPRAIILWFSKADKVSEVAGCWFEGKAVVEEKGRRRREDSE